MLKFTTLLSPLLLFLSLSYFSWGADSKNEISTQNKDGTVRIRLAPPRNNDPTQVKASGATEVMLRSTQNPPAAKNKSKVSMVCTPAGGKPVTPGEAGFNECMKDAQQKGNTPYSNPANNAGTGLQFGSGN